MVVRHYCRCMTCGHAHTLRIGVGWSPYQEHTFRCGGCGEEMVVGMTVDSQNVSVDVKCVSNTEHGDKEGLIINLHPQFPIPEDQLHQDQAFPWFEHMRDIAIAQMEAMPALIGFKSLEEIRAASTGMQTTVEAWGNLKKGWSLTRNGRLDLAQAELRKYRTGAYSGPPDLPHVLFHFCRVMLGYPRLQLFAEAAATTAATRDRAPSKYEDFRSFYLANLRGDHETRYFDVFSEYFRDFSELSQTLLLCQYDLPLARKAAASSNAFARTKMLYGNLFEAITSNFTVLACLNNVANGRDFGSFATMDLKKYLTINKAQRANPFTENVAYANLAKFLDSTLRNASHHSAMTLDVKSGRVTYRSGGTGAPHQITYADYLYRCNQVFLRLCALLMLELGIVF